MPEVSLPASRKRTRPGSVNSAMADPIVIAHLVTEQGERVCKASDVGMSVDFTAATWAAHVRSDHGSSVVRCRRCAALSAPVLLIRVGHPSRNAVAA